MVTKAIDIFDKVHLKSKLLNFFLVDHQINLHTIILYLKKEEAAKLFHNIIHHIYFCAHQLEEK
jgi:hypothetical protein